MRSWCTDFWDRGGGRARRRRRARCAKGHPERVEDERGADMRGELPAHGPAGVEVDDEAEEHDAFRSEVPSPIRVDDIATTMRASTTRSAVPRARIIAAMRASRIASKW